MSETVMPGSSREATTFLISPPRREEWNQDTVDELLAFLADRLPALTFRIMIHTPMGDDHLFSCLPLLNEFGPIEDDDAGDGYMRILSRPSEATIDLIAAALDDFPPQPARASATVAVESSLRLARLGQRRQVH